MFTLNVKEFNFCFLSNHFSILINYGFQVFLFPFALHRSIYFLRLSISNFIPATIRRGQLTHETICIKHTYIFVKIISQVTLKYFQICKRNPNNIGYNRINPVFIRSETQDIFLSSFDIHEIKN